MMLGMVRKAVFEHVGDAAVDRWSLALRNRLVRRILHERMLERVERVGNIAALMNELGRDRLVEQGFERRVGERRDGLQDLVTKLAAERGTDLHDASRRRD